MSLEIEYTAPRSVRDAAASVGRTEDLRFSPNSRRLAVAAYARNRIAVFDVDIASSGSGTRVALTGGVELTSSALKLPHGVDFVDDDTLIVTNRDGDVALFTLPPGDIGVRSCDVLPIMTWPAGGASLLQAPGSVSLRRVEGAVYEVLICNNTGRSVTRHILDCAAGAVVRRSDILLRNHLDVPDGVSLSPDRRWVAVSDHTSHNVLLYENPASLNAEAEPVGILRRVICPHGLCFSADGRYLFVADGAAPHVHVYAQDPDEWRGVRHPVATVRVLDEAVFQGGHPNPDHGGPKGLDIDASSTVLAISCECQPLAFFDLPAVLQQGLAGKSAGEEKTVDFRYELALMDASHWHAAHAREGQSLCQYMLNSRSWRITAPLRRLDSALRRHN